MQEEIEEIENREELFREALVKEIEGKVGEMRELEGAGKDREKEKELVWRIYQYSQQFAELTSLVVNIYCSLWNDRRTVRLWLQSHKVLKQCRVEGNPYNLCYNLYYLMRCGFKHQKDPFFTVQTANLVSLCFSI